MSTTASLKSGAVRTCGISATIRKWVASSKQHGRRAVLPGACAALLTSCATPHVKDTSRSFRTVVIDPGHGGHDSGARSRWAGSEKAATLEVARRLEPKLQAAGFKTILTRRNDDFIGLNERAAISNRQHDAVFVSIHFNQTRARRIRGTEVYYKSAVSRPLAEGVLRNVASLRGGASRGVKPADFRVLRLSKYPAVLVECGFLSNPTEGRRCASSGHRESLASAIAAAITAQRHGMRGSPPTAAR